MTCFIRPMRRGILKVYAAAYAAWRGLGRSDVIQNYFFGQGFLFRDRDRDINIDLPCT